MMTGVATLFTRVFTWPNARAWGESTALLTLFASISVPFSLLSGLFAWTPSTDGLWQVALVAFFLPALTEELAFRGPLLILGNKTLHFQLAAMLLALFVLWHLVNAWLLMTEARGLFDDPRFLVVAFGLGMTCTFATFRSRSLWPAIFIHWLVVVGWKGLFGGPQFLVGG